MSYCSKGKQSPPSGDDPPQDGNQQQQQQQRSSECTLRSYPQGLQAPGGAHVTPAGTAGVSRPSPEDAQGSPHASDNETDRRTAAAETTNADSSATPTFTQKRKAPPSKPPDDMVTTRRKTRREQTLDTADIDSEPDSHSIEQDRIRYTTAMKSKGNRALADKVNAKRHGVHTKSHIASTSHQIKISSKTRRSASERLFLRTTSLSFA